MASATAKIDPGVCGFLSEVTVQCDDGQNAHVRLETECPNLKPMADALEDTDAFAACFGKLCDSSIMQAANEYCAHAACPVPGAVIKAIEAACGFALPKDVHISIEKEG